MEEKRTFILIEDWMWERLGLVGNKLLVYAIIYGFCTYGDGDFHGSQVWLAARLGCARSTVQEILLALEKKGLLKKQPRKLHETNRYTAVVPAGVPENRARGCLKTGQGVPENRAPGCLKTGHKTKEKKKTEKDSQNMGEIRTNITEEDLAWVLGTGK